VKDDPDWGAAVWYISALLASCAVVYFTSTVVAFCELDIPSSNLIAWILMFLARYWGVSFRL
jgi:hypothetical protein